MRAALAAGLAGLDPAVGPEWWGALAGSAPAATAGLLHAAVRHAAHAEAAGRRGGEGAGGRRDRRGAQGGGAGQRRQHREGGGQGAPGLLLRVAALDALCGGELSAAQEQGGLEGA